MFTIYPLPPTIIGYHSNVLSDLKTNVRLIINIHMPINAENLIKVGRANSEIIGLIC